MSNPLQIHHEKMGAKLTEGRLPLSYTNPVEEYWTVRKHAGLADLTHLGLLQATGKDRLSFLNALLPNELSKLHDGTGARSALLNTKARVLADLHIYAREEDLLIDTGDTPVTTVKDILEQFIITEDVRIKDLTAQYVHLTLQGPEATQHMKDTLGVTFPEPQPLQHKMQGPSMTIVRDRTGQSGFDLIVPNDEAEPVWQSFLLKGVAPFGLDALETLRLEAGYPRYGIDMDENTIILEAGFKDTISFSKGCYLGQEVVARASHIGRVNKNLVQFQAESEHAPSPRSRLKSDGKDAGYVTSAAFSPGLKAIVGLGYAQRDFAKEGTRLVIESEGRTLPTAIRRIV